MAQRSIWKGMVSFGVVSIPVKLYTATEEKDIGFNLLHRACGARIKQQRYCPNCEKAIEWGDVNRGFEVAKNQFVVLEEQDFQALPLKSLKSIDIEGFVAPDQMPLLALSKPYYLAPEDLGAKPFVLLRKAMEATGLVAVGKLALRERERPGVIRPYGDFMLIHLLHYAEEIRPVEMALPAVGVSEKEMNLGMALVNSLKYEVFDLGVFQDEYRQALEKLIQAKLEGKALPAPAEAPPAGVGDLADALLASLASVKK